jgi:transcriptional regulator with XRE-family HTH domain
VAGPGDEPDGYPVCVRAGARARRCAGRSRRTWGGRRRRCHLEPQVREFLISRRERISPAQAGLPAYRGANRRVKGLRREEVALLAGVSIDYYVRMERGNLAGASAAVLDGIATALQLDEAERAHLFDLARAAQPAPLRHRRAKASGVTDVIQQILDSITEAPAWVRNARHDMLAANRLARALYSPVLADPRRPANNARFVYLDPAASGCTIRLSASSTSIFEAWSSPPTPGWFAGRCHQ